MSLTPIPYQPLPVEGDPNCTLPSYKGWVQQVELSDPTQVQFIAGACGHSLNILANGTFVDGDANWTTGGTWDFSGNKACSAIGSNDFIQQDIPDVAGYVYQLAFDLELFAGSVVVSTPLGFAAVAAQSGEVVVTFASGGVTNVNIFVNSNSAACIRNVRLLPVNTRWRVGVEDLEGNELAVLPSTAFKFTRSFLTITADWNALALPLGCYRLAIYDPCDCAQFGFAGDELELPRQWRILPQSTGTGSVGNGLMSGISVMGAAETIFRMTNVICPNVAYTFTYTLTGMTGLSSFRLFAGNANGVTRTADGTYTETITSTHSGELPSDLRARFVLTGAGSFTMSNFSMEAVEKRVTYRTVPFQLVADGSCTTLFNACGNTDQFNMGFADINFLGNVFGQTGFSPRIRLQGTLRGSGYIGTRSGYEFSTGRKVSTHLRTRKSKEFGFYAPEYVHDFMQLLRGFDNVYINGGAVYSEDDEYPSLSAEADVDMAAVTLTFSDRTELTEAVRVTSLQGAGCSTRGTNLLTTRAGRPTGFNVQGGKTPFLIGG